MVCDIKNSRNIINREELQYRIIDMLKEINKKHSELIVSPFIITLGDEWQGLLKYPSPYEKIVDFFNDKLGEVQFYCGIGVGDISIHNFELTVNQLDGPSFHKARRALSIAKDANYSMVLIK
jgi:hypothetical protein